MVERKAFLLGCAVAAVGLFASGAEAADKVTFVTDFGFNGRHAFLFVATEKGYYKDENLEVTLVRGQGSNDALKQIAAGSAHMGLADATTLTVARANDKLPVKLVASIYANVPQALYFMADSNIKTPKDLEGKTIADTPAGSLKIMFPIYARLAGIDATKVNWISMPADAEGPSLFTGKVDAAAQYTIGEPLMVKLAAPRKVAKLTFADVGIEGYNTSIVAPDATISGNPDLVRRITRATLKGLAAAIANPKEAGAIMHKYHREVDEDIGEGETKIVGDLARRPGVPLGFLEKDRVEKTVQLVKDTLPLKGPISPEEVYAPGFVSN